MDLPGIEDDDDEVRVATVEEEEELPDGVYLRLSPERYFKQDRLGSTDLIKLGQRKEGWWWQSRHNPRLKKASTEAQNFGSATHAIILEGEHAYETRFAVKPDKPAGAIETIPDMKKALREAGLDFKGTSDWKLNDWAAAMAVHAPEAPCWPNIEADFRRRKGDDRAEISADEDWALRVMYETALENPEIGPLIRIDGEVPVLAEVSVFWTDQFGVRRRARFDKPAPKFTMDLKTLGNFRGRSLAAGAGDVIQFEGYDIQLADQHVARRRAYEMVLESEEHLHGGSDEERDWFLAMAHRAPWLPKGIQWEWKWLFYQKPEPSGLAPVIFPVHEDWKGPFHVSGHRKAYRAIQTYLECVERFGLDKPWTRSEPVHYTDQELQPHIFLPSGGWEIAPVPEEEKWLS